MNIKRLISLCLFTAFIFSLCACENKNKNNISNEVKANMSMAATPEEIMIRALTAIASNDEQAYKECFPRAEASFHNEYTDVHSCFAKHCMALNLDYDIKRSPMAFTIYIITDNRSSGGLVSFRAFLKGTDEISIKIKTEFDIYENKYYIDDIESSVYNDVYYTESSTKNFHEALDITNLI